MSRFKIHHITRYTYNSTVIDSANQILLYPIRDEHQQVVQHELNISLNPPVEIFTDYFGNQAGIFTIIKPHTELSIESIIEVVTHPIAVPVNIAPASEQWQQLNEHVNDYPYVEFLSPENFEGIEEMKHAIESIRDWNAAPFETAMTMSGFVYNYFTYRQGITSVETGIEEVWKLKAGVCQDFAHILLVMLRMLQIPARYVSGYICPKNHDMRGEGATHAWVEAFIPNHGWIGLDPTNNCVVSDRHVRLAVGRNFSDCTPVKGTYKGSSEHTLEVSVAIENGSPKETSDGSEMPVQYVAQKPAVVQNSYRRFMEMQQQQQQQ